MTEKNSDQISDENRAKFQEESRSIKFVKKSGQISAWNPLKIFLYHACFHVYVNISWPTFT